MKKYSDAVTPDLHLMRVRSGMAALLELSCSELNCPWVESDLFSVFCQTPDEQSQRTNVMI